MLLQGGTDVRASFGQTAPLRSLPTKGFSSRMSMRRKAKAFSVLSRSAPCRTPSTGRAQSTQVCAHWRLGRHLRCPCVSRLTRLPPPDLDSPMRARVLSDFVESAGKVGKHSGLARKKWRVILLNLAMKSLYERCIETGRWALRPFTPGFRGDYPPRCRFQYVSHLRSRCSCPSLFACSNQADCNTARTTEATASSATTLAAQIPTNQSHWRTRGEINGIPPRRPFHEKPNRTKQCRQG